MQTFARSAALVGARVGALAAAWLLSAAPALGDEAARDLRALEPFAQPPTSFFYAPLGQPLLRPAFGPPEGALDVTLRSTQSRSHASGTRAGQENRFDGWFSEYALLDLELGVRERFAIHTSVRLAGWDERRDVFRVFTGGALPAVEGEAAKEVKGIATQRHENIADWTLGQRFEVLRAADDRFRLGAALDVKVPVARTSDLTHAGTTDVAFSALGSLVLEGFAAHLNAALVTPLGEQTIFVGPDPDLGAFGHFAGGIVFAPLDFLSLGASIETSTKAWHGVAFLDHIPVTAALGVRAVAGSLTFELGGGGGLTTFSADVLAWLEVSYRFEGLFGP